MGNCKSICKNDEIKRIDAAGLSMAGAWFAIKFRAMVRESGGHLRRSHRWLAQQMGCSVRSVQAYIAEMEAAELILVARQYSDDTERNCTNIYHLPDMDLRGGAQNLPQYRDIKKEQETELETASSTFIDQTGITGIARQIGATRPIEFVEAAWERSHGAKNREAYFARLLITGELYGDDPREGRDTQADNQVDAMPLLALPSPVRESAPEEPATIDAAIARDFGVMVNQAELQLDRATFASWVRGARLLSAENGFLVVAVGSAYAVSQNEGKLARFWGRLVRDCVGDWQIKFVERAFA